MSQNWWNIGDYIIVESVTSLKTKFTYIDIVEDKNEVKILNLKT